MAEYTQIPGTLNINTTRDDDLYISLQWTGESGTAIDFSTYTFDAVLDVSSTDKRPGTVTIVDAINGKIAVSFAKTTLSSIQDGPYSWHLNWSHNSASRRVMSGYFILMTNKETA